MDENRLEIKVSLKIQKPVSLVFEAIVDPSKMSNYFIEKSSGKMEEGKTVIWKFPEFDAEFPVEVIKLEQDKLISFSWADMHGSKTLVEIELKPMDQNETFVTIKEGSLENTAQGIQWLKSNTEGWANFLACLKAYLDHGINLRKGAFDISQMPTKETNAENTVVDNGQS